MLGNGHGNGQCTWVWGMDMVMNMGMSMNIAMYMVTGIDMVVLSWVRVRVHSGSGYTNQCGRCDYSPNHHHQSCMNIDMDMGWGHG